MQASGNQARSLALGAGLAALAVPALSGCVAAAIPLAAGGALMRSEPVSGKTGSSHAARPAPPASEVAGATPVDAPRYEVLDSSSLPVPTEADAQSARRKSLLERSFDGFYGYALAQASTSPLEAPMRSAMLRDPSSLEPLREDCGTKPPLVLVDLDPGEAVFDPAAPGQGNGPLTEVLAVLRSRKLDVAWISSLPVSASSAVHERLRVAGLDPAGKDHLLLTSPDLPSKQVLRRSLDDTACIVAIAGDTRSDFDELYSYLNNPDAAFALNEMFGEGWFLTPLPIEPKD